MQNRSGVCDGINCWPFEYKKSIWFGKNIFIIPYYAIESVKRKHFYFCEPCLYCLLRRRETFAVVLLCMHVFYVYLWCTGADPREGRTRRAPPQNWEKIWFFGVKSWFFTRNTPTIFAPPSARRNFFKCAHPNLKSLIRPWFMYVCMYAYIIICMLLCDLCYLCTFNHVLLCNVCPLFCLKSSSSMLYLYTLPTVNKYYLALLVFKI